MLRNDHDGSLRQAEKRSRVALTNIKEIAMTSPDPMSINTVASNVLSPSVLDIRQAQDQQPPAKATNDAKPVQNQQGSTVVKLSAEGQQLSRADINSPQSPNSESTEPPAKETAEPSGIQLIEGESKGGRVSTFA
jgi:hypothetical protein